MGFCNYLIVILLTISIVKILTCKWRHGKSTGYRLRQFDTVDTQPLRGIMALLIVATHVSFKYSTEHFAVGFTSFGAPIVSVFFFLSGYGLCIQYSRKGNEMLNGFVKKSLKKILPSFLLASAIWIGISYFIWDLNPVAQLVNLIIFRPPLPYSWFIYALLIFYMGFYLIFRFVKSDVRIKQVLLIILTLCETIFLRLANFEVYWYISLFAFNVGALYGSNSERINNMIQQCPLFSVVGLTVGFMVLMFMGIRTGLLAVIPLGVIIPILILGSGCRVTPFVKLGHLSYEIYLAHGIIIPIVEIYELSWPIYLFTAEVGSFLLAMVIRYIIIKYQSFISLLSAHECVDNQNITPPPHYAIPFFIIRFLEEIKIIINSIYLSMFRPRLIVKIIDVSESSLQM